MRAEADDESLQQQTAERRVANLLLLLLIAGLLLGMQFAEPLQILAHHRAVEFRMELGGQGVIAMGTKGRNGLLVGAIQVQEGEEIMLISDQGTLVRTRVGEVSSLSRNTQGVTLIKLAADETLVGLERIQEPSEDELDDVIEAGEEGAPLDAVDAADEDSAGAEEAPQE